MWVRVSFTIKDFQEGRMAQVWKLDHSLFLRAGSFSQHGSGSVKNKQTNKKKPFSLWCSGDPEAAHLRVAYLMAALVASDTLCSAISPGSSKCRVLSGEDLCRGSVWRWGLSPWWKEPGSRHILSTLNDIVKKIIHTWHLMKCQN